MRTMRRRILIVCIAVGIGTGCMGIDHDLTRVNEIEDVYVFRSKPVSANLAVTSFCDPAGFPSTHHVVREVYYEYSSTNTRDDDGRLLNAAVKVVGSHRGCYSDVVDGVTWTYAEGTFAGIPFKLRGNCAPKSDKAPQRGSIPYTCTYSMIELPTRYVGGIATFNGMSTTNTGYLTSAIATLRLWKGP